MFRLSLYFNDDNSSILLPELSDIVDNVTSKEYKTIQEAIDAAKEEKIPLIYLKISEWDEINDEMIGVCCLDEANESGYERLDF